MGWAYGLDLGRRVVDAIEGGMSHREASARFCVAVSTAGNWHRLWRLAGSASRAGKAAPAAPGLMPMKRRSWRWSMRALTLPFTRLPSGYRATMVFAPPRPRFGCSSGSGTSALKKTAHAREQQRPDVRARREDWFAGQLELDPEKLIFIDETGGNTKMARLRGGSAKGERCRASIPHGHWKTTMFTAALRVSGMTAPMVLDGAMNGPAFRAYVKQGLVP